MKKQNLSEMIRGKGYYLLLFVGIIAISLVAIIGMQISSNKNGNIVDLNESNQNIASKDDNRKAPTEDNLTNDMNKTGINTELAKQPQEDTNTTHEISLLESDVFSEEDDTTIKKAENASAQENTTEVAQEEPQTVPVNKPSAVNLSFDENQTLEWPVIGNVILPFSMDHSIYFSTLQLYKCNPAIIIDAEVGTSVVAAAKGIITEIQDSAETGFTITMDIGDGYEVSYGQLANVNLEVGDVVERGTSIGTVNYPTKYYSVEGSNLYFQLQKEDVPENPMLYLE